MKRVTQYVLLVFILSIGISSCSDNLETPEPQDPTANPILKKISYERLAFGTGRIMNFNALGQDINSTSLDDEQSYNYVYNADGKVETLSINPLVNTSGGSKEYTYQNGALHQSTEQFGDLIGAPTTSTYTYVDNTIERTNLFDADQSLDYSTRYTFTDNTLKYLTKIERFDDPNGISISTSSLLLFYDVNMNINRLESWQRNNTQDLEMTFYTEYEFDDKNNASKNSIPLEMIVQRDMFPDTPYKSLADALNKFSPNNVTHRASYSTNGAIYYDLNHIYTYNEDDYPVTAEVYASNGNLIYEFVYEYYD